MNVGRKMLRAALARQALATFPSDTGLGWDGIHPRALLRVDDATDNLTEAEIIALSMALTLEGLPAQDFWDEVAPLFSTTTPQYRLRRASSSRKKSSSCYIQESPPAIPLMWRKTMKR